MEASGLKKGIRFASMHRRTSTMPHGDITVCSYHCCHCQPYCLCTVHPQTPGWQAGEGAVQLHLQPPPVDLPPSEAAGQATRTRRLRRRAAALAALLHRLQLPALEPVAGRWLAPRCQPRVL